MRLPKVCVAVIGSDANDMVEKAEALVRDNSFLEFRLDYLSRPALALPRIKRFTEYHPHIIVIGTCRRAANGGRFRGSLASQLDILAHAQRLTAHVIESGYDVLDAGWDFVLGVFGWSIPFVQVVLVENGQAPFTVEHDPSNLMPPALIDLFRNLN